MIIITANNACDIRVSALITNRYYFRSSTHKEGSIKRSENQSSDVVIQDVDKYLNDLENLNSKILCSH